MKGHEQTNVRPESTSASPGEFLIRLGLAYNCSESDVRNAYLRLANNAHPDHGGDAQFFRQLQQDYEQALNYARNQRIPRVHNFFLSPWNAKTIRHQRRRAISLLLRLIAVVVISSLVAWQFTHNFIVPSTIIGVTFAAGHMCLMASLRPIVSFFGIVGSLILLTLCVAMIAQEGAFARPWEHYSSFNDFSPSDQLQLGLLSFAGLLLPASIMGWVVSLTDRGIS